MSKKLYQVKIKQGFNAGQRRRAGIELEKNVPQVVELTEDQLTELQNDSWIDVKPYSEVQKDKAAKKNAAAKTGKKDAEQPEQPEEPESPEDGDDEEETEEVDLSTKSFKQLQEIATGLELDIEGLKSKAQLIELIEANAEQPEQPEE